MKIRKEEIKKELNILLFRETKPHDVSLQPQRERKEQKDWIKRHHILKRVSAFKRHAAV